MPPSIPSHGGVNDPSNGVAARLPLIRESTRTTRNPKRLGKSSSRSASTVKQPQRVSSGRRRANDIRLGSNRNRNNRTSTRPLKKNSGSGQTSSASPRKRSITNAENDFESSSNVDSSSNPVAVSSASPLDTSGLAPYGGISTVSPYGFYGGAASMMPPSPFMGMGMNTMGLPYLSGLNQIVFNIQNIVFSISQAIHVVGANQQALQHAWESLNQMIDHAVATFHEMRALESLERECESEEQQSRRKRLKALRYAFVFGGSWLAYKLIRNLLFRKRSLQQQQPGTAALLGRSSHYGQSSVGNLSTSYPGNSNLPHYLSRNDFYGDANMGYPGYQSNYNALGSNGYY